MPRLNLPVFREFWEEETRKGVGTNLSSFAEVNISRSRLVIFLTMPHKENMTWRTPRCDVAIKDHE